MAEPARRGVVRLVVAGASTALAALYAIPAFRFLAGARVREDASAVDAGPLAALPDGAPTLTVIERPFADAWSENTRARTGVFLVRAGSEVRALDALCPHTGCTVDYDERRREFRCPCHNSRFSIAGERLSGPSPRGLDPQTAEVQGGRVRVRYCRYRTGRADRVPL